MSRSVTVTELPIEVTLESEELSYKFNNGASNFPQNTRISKNGRITWKFAEQDPDTAFLTVFIGWNTPLIDSEKNRAVTLRGRRGEITAHVAPDAAEGVYKYSIAVHCDGEIFMDDPEFIVDGMHYP